MQLKAARLPKFDSYGQVSYAGFNVERINDTKYSKTLPKEMLQVYEIQPTAKFHGILSVNSG